MAFVSAPMDNNQLIIDVRTEGFCVALRSLLLYDLLKF